LGYSSEAKCEIICPNDSSATHKPEFADFISTPVYEMRLLGAPVMPRGQGRSQNLNLGRLDKGGAEGPERGTKRRGGVVWGGLPSPVGGSGAPPENFANSTSKIYAL